MSFKWFIGWFLTQVYIGTFCRLGFHWFVYYSERHKVNGIEHLGITELDVPVRECDCCGVRHHHLRPRHRGFSDWQVFSHQPEEEMNLTND